MASYRKICKAAAERLKEVGIEDAVYDARALLLHVTGMSFTDFLLRQDEEMPEGSCEIYVNLIRRRAMRIPLQHLTGTQWFYGLEFRVNEHVLIPRPETELLVETALMYYRSGRKFSPDLNAVLIPDLNRWSSIPDTKAIGTPYAGSAADPGDHSSIPDMKVNAAPYAASALDPNVRSSDQDTEVNAAPYAGTVSDFNVCSLNQDTETNAAPYAGTVSDFNVCSLNQDMEANAAPYAVPASDLNDISPLQDTKTAAVPFEILDMCTGSGCILLSLLHELPGARGTGADISGEALEVARENARRLGIAAVPVNPADSSDPEELIYNSPAVGADSAGKAAVRLSWLQSDMFEKVTGRYDLIVSNPPYIRRQEIETLAPEVRDHDPRAALDGGSDGLEFYRILASQSPGYLKEGARLILEIGADQASDVTALLQDAGFSDISVRQDLNGLDRVVCAGLTRKSGFDLF